MTSHVTLPSIHCHMHFVHTNKWTFSSDTLILSISWSAVCWQMGKFRNAWLKKKNSPDNHMFPYRHDIGSWLCCVSGFIDLFTWPPIHSTVSLFAVLASTQTDGCPKKSQEMVTCPSCWTASSSWTKAAGLESSSLPVSLEHIEYVCALTYQHTPTTTD